MALHHFSPCYVCHSASPQPLATPKSAGRIRCNSTILELNIRIGCMCGGAHSVPFYGIEWWTCSGGMLGSSETILIVWGGAVPHHSKSGVVEPFGYIFSGWFSSLLQFLPLILVMMLNKFGDYLFNPSLQAVSRFHAGDYGNFFISQLSAPVSEFASLVMLASSRINYYI